MLMLTSLFPPIQDSSKPPYLWKIGSANEIGQESIIYCGAKGCSTYQENPYMDCTPTGGFAAIIQQIPLLSSAVNWLASQMLKITGENPKAQQCYTDKSGVLMTFTFNPYNPDSIKYVLISVLFTVIGTVVLISIAVGTSILGVKTGEFNSGSVLTLIVGISAIMIWTILSGSALLTFQTSPYQLGGYIYFIMTLMYAIGIIQMIGGSMSK